MAYLTEQRKVLYNFFESHPHDSFCVRDIHDALADSGISLSAIYRNLSSMKKEGVVRCYAHEGSRDIYYRFVGNVHCADAIHLTCTDCGRTYHMSSEAASKMQSELNNLEGFRINRDKTVLYGVCKECVK